MKTKIIIALSLLIIGIIQSCELTKEEYNKITPENFYKSQVDAKLAVVGLYSNLLGLFDINIRNDLAAGDMMRGVAGYAVWDGLFHHEWTETRALYTDTYFSYYKHIQSARIVAREIEAMQIPDNAKSSLSAEANALAGWLAYILYDWYGPVPFPTDENLKNPQELNYPSRPSDEEFVEIIENFFKEKDNLNDPDFGSDYGKMNKGIANFILMKLYMLEAGRTGNTIFWEKAKSIGEEIISSGWYQLEKNYRDIFALSNEKNREIILARPGDYSFNGNAWHARMLTNNYPCALNRGAGAWATYKLIWSFYDTYQTKKDLRLSTIVSSYVTDEGLLIDRQHPFNSRQGLEIGPLAMKYDPDDNQVGENSAHDYILYRYADVLLQMSEILNELGVNSTINSPVIQQIAKDGTVLQSDGGNSALSFLNAIRVRAGLFPLQNDLTQSQLRDSILMERGHELYAEGMRRTDLIRYQRVTDGTGYKIFDPDEYKFLMPIPVSYINEYKGKIAQNTGY